MDQNTQNHPSLEEQMNRGGQGSTRRKPSTKSQIIRKTVLMGVFAAMAYAVTFVLHIKVSFLTFDAKDAVITIATMLLGPLAGIIIPLIVSLLELITISDTGLYGFIMNFASSATFAAVAGFVYRKAHTLNGAVASLLAGVVAMTSTMMLLNVLVTPHFMGAPTEAVVKMIPTLLLPFNLVKSLLNAGLVLILYRPVSVALRRSKMLPASFGDASDYRLRPDRRSLLVLITGLVLVATCVSIFLVLLHGSFELHK